MSAAMSWHRPAMQMWMRGLGRVRAFSTSGSGSSKVGFVGLGNMGGPMALNLLKNGHQVVAFDLSKDALKAVEAKGGTCVECPSIVASSAEIIVTMLPDSLCVKATYLGDKGILNNMAAGSLLIDSSTVEPEVPKELAVVAKKKGAVLVDAPVSGGVNAAKAGSLTFMVGCDDVATFNVVKDILENMGKNVVHCGPVGAGQAAKICNNMLLAISMIGVSETMNLGVKLGLDPKILADIINSSSGRCWSSEVYNPVPGVMSGVPSSNDYQGGFGSALMTKDLGLAQNASTTAKTPTPLGSLAHQIYKLMLTQGYGGLDFSSVYKFFSESKK